MESVARALTLEEVILEFKRPILVDENGCWNWLGSVSNQGYAMYNNKPVYGLLSRMVGRECSTDKVFRHTCANKRCINLEHVIEGTFAENMIDAIRDGARKLRREHYAEMVTMYNSGSSQADIARKLNISRSMVSQFFQGKFMAFKPEDFEESNAKLS